MMSNDAYEKQIKLRASIEEFVEPLLKRISVVNGPNKEIVKNMRILIEECKEYSEARQIWDRELMRVFGDIERQIEYCENNKGILQQNSSIHEPQINFSIEEEIPRIDYFIDEEENCVNFSTEEEIVQQNSSIDDENSERIWTALLEKITDHLHETDVYRSMFRATAHQRYPNIVFDNFDEQLNRKNMDNDIKEMRKSLEIARKSIEKSRVSPSIISTTAQQKESIFFEKATTYEAGATSNTNNQVEDVEKKLTEYRNECSPQEKIWLDSLGIFPLNTKLKKRLLVHLWIGLEQRPSEGNTIVEQLAVVQLAKNFFNSLVNKGILEPIRRKHNQVINLCTIKPAIYNQLKGILIGTSSVIIEGVNWHLVRDNKKTTRAILNVDQKYLRSNNIENVLDDNSTLQVLHFGRWDYTDKKSQYHIEVDGIAFLKKLGKYVIFLSLSGISMIDELPESIGKLKNLRILDLRACHNLAKLPHKPKSKVLSLKSRQKSCFINLTHLDISDCYMLNHMPKWICELHNLEVFKGYVAGNEGRRNQFCQLRDLSQLKKLRKLSIRIVKPLDSEDARGLESMDRLSILTVSWSIHEDNNERDKVWTISFPKHLEKLDIRCYPEADATEQLNPSVLPKLKRLYIRGGQLANIGDDSDWMVVILRLRILKFLKIEWHELGRTFTNLKYVEYKWCPKLKNFPDYRSAWNVEKDGPIPKYYEPKPVEMKIRSNYTVSLEENKQKIMLELTGRDSITDRPTNLNLVAVLDVSKGIEDDNKIENLKTAMLFVINKLRSDDRLAIVTFPNPPSSQRELQPITESSRRELEMLVTGLRAGRRRPPKCLLEGLKVGLDILKDNNISGKDCIILLSGITNYISSYEGFESLPFVAVHTFHLGIDYSPLGLESIACKSRGGTYSEVRNPENLINAVSVCLAGLLTVAFQDLTLTLTPIKELSKIEHVSAGDYQQFKDDGVGSVTIEFGDLYRGEVRKVLVDLLLPAVDEEGDAQVLQVGYSYRSYGELLSHPPVDIRVRRKRTVSAYQPRVLPEVFAEEARLQTVRMLSELIYLVGSESGEIKKATYDAKYFLEDKKINLHEKNELLELLSAELQELLERTEDSDLWKRLVYSIMSSHNRQRVAARGDDIEKCLSFATPDMLSFLREAEEFSANHRLLRTPIE